MQQGIFQEWEAQFTHGFACFLRQCLHHTVVSPLVCCTIMVGLHSYPEDKVIKVLQGILIWLIDLTASVSTVASPPDDAAAGADKIDPSLTKFASLRK
jgi:hypothetical protein